MNAAEPIPRKRLEDLSKLVSLCKRRGIIFPSSEIYGGFASVWDYGPVGALLKANVKAAWLRSMVQMRDDIVQLDSAILMHPQTWVASGHVEHFNDPLVDCLKCKQRFRSDDISSATCPSCGGELTQARQFNTMFKTFVGPVEEDAAVAYLRPETAQGIFVDFKNVLDTSRKKLPFGIAQVGKAFRNEITTGNFIFRVREFEQMELEFFVAPGTASDWYEHWLGARLQWWQDLGIRADSLRLYHKKGPDLAHYSRAGADIEFLFPFGWGELEGIADRGDYDLLQHETSSGEDLKYFDEETRSRIRPEVIEPSAGVDRAVLAFLSDAFDEEPDKDEVRVVLRLHPRIAPYKVAVLPLQRKEPLVNLARDIQGQLRRRFQTIYDETGSIGRRYRRQDEVGTPYCITPDFESLEQNTITIRERDSMAQVRLPIAELESWLAERVD
ncbi:MAG: glycine--tRNA ligase [Chloroflexota bacterium]